jgi:fibronectin type III domain protein
MSKGIVGLVCARRVSALLAAFAALALLIAAEANAQTTGTTTTGGTTTGGTGTTGSGSGSVIDLGHNARVVFVVVVAGLFALLWFALILQDRIKTNKRLDKLLAALIADVEPRTPDQRLTVEEIKALTSAASARGAPGLTRTTIALGLLTLVAVALAALLVGNGSQASDLLKTVVTALTTALATVLGFYFGAKATTEGVEKGGAAAAGGGSGPSTPTGPPDAPTDVAAEAGTGQATVTFTAPTKTGGSPITGYTVTSNPGAIKATGAASPITVTGLSSDVEYTFTVRATNASGDGPESSASTGVKPK